MSTNKRIKKLIGTALNDSRDKTVKVELDLLKIHPLYHSRYISHRTVLAHSETEIKKGQKVAIISTRPISRRKSWKVVE